MHQGITSRRQSVCNRKRRRRARRTGGAEQGHAIGRGRRRAQTTNYADNDPPDCLAEAELPDSGRTDGHGRD